MFDPRTALRRLQHARIDLHNAIEALGDAMAALDGSDSGAVQRLRSRTERLVASAAVLEEWVSATLRDVVTQRRETK